MLPICKWVSRHNAVQTFSKRMIRTWKHVKPVQDLESQLQAYPPEFRKTLLEKLHQTTQDTAMDAPARPDLQEAEYNAAILSAYLLEIESFDELDLPFWQTAKSLARSVTAAKSPEYLELFSMLFEAAKSIESSPQLRTEMIYQIGRYIYRQRRVRLDPVNEVEFLDSLVANKRAFAAVRLWEMRRGRDEVKHSSYWNEMGVLFYLDAGLISHANALAQQLKQPNGRVVASLIGGWCFLLRRQRLVAESQHWIEHWTNFFIANMDHFGSEDIDQVLAVLLHSRRWSCVQRILAKCDRPINPQVLIIALEQSASVKTLQNYSEESDFLNLFEQLLAVCGPEIAADGTVSASLALSFARQDDKETALSLISDLEERGISDIPQVFQTELAKLLLDSYEQWPSILKKSSLAVLIGLRSSKWSMETKEAAWKTYRELAGPEASILPQLAAEAMKQKILPSSEILRIVSNSNSSQLWTHLWYLIAAKKIDVNALDALKLMLDVKYTDFNAQQLVYIAQSIESDDLVGFLQSCKQSSSPALDKFLARLFVKAVKNHAHGRRSIIRKPNSATPATMADPEISWAQISQKIKN